MFQKLFVPIAVASFLLVSDHLYAGGPARICLPIDGVTSENADACAKRLTEALSARLWKYSRTNNIVMRENVGQWYAMFYPMKDVRLSDVEAALEGSSFAVPRDKLRMFGHVILEIEVGDSAREALINELAGLKHVSVDGTDQSDNVAVVTIDMPYPDAFGREREQFGTQPFEELRFIRNDFSSDRSTKSNPPATVSELPTLGVFQEVLARRKAKLIDLRWSSRWGCRILGCVTAKAAKGKNAAESYANLDGDYGFSYSRDRATFVLAIRVDKSGKLTANWRSGDREIPVTDLKYQDGTLTFDSEIGSYKGSLTKSGALNGTYTTNGREYSVLSKKLR
jgi:hypothetical protein